MDDSEFVMLFQALVLNLETYAKAHKVKRPYQCGLEILYFEDSLFELNHYDQSGIYMRSYRFALKFVAKINPEKLFKNGYVYPVLEGSRRIKGMVLTQKAATFIINEAKELTLGNKKAYIIKALGDDARYRVVQRIFQQYPEVKKVFLSDSEIKIAKRINSVSGWGIFINPKED